MMTPRNHGTAGVMPELAAAGAFVAGLAAQDFGALGGALAGGACGRHPGLRLAVDREALAWAHGDGLVLRGLVSLPVVLGPNRRELVPGPGRRPG